MFPDKNTLYVVGYTVRDARDVGRLYDLLEKHKNVFFRVIDTGHDHFCEDFWHEQVGFVPYVKPGPGQVPFVLVVREPLVLDKQDIDEQCIYNKGKSCPVHLMSRALDFAAKNDLPYFCCIEYYRLDRIESTKQDVVNAGAHYGAYRGLLQI